MFIDNASSGNYLFPCDSLVYPVCCPPKIDIGNKSVCHPLMALAGKLLWKSLSENCKHVEQALEFASTSTVVVFVLVKLLCCILCSAIWFVGALLSAIISNVV